MTPDTGESSPGKSNGLPGEPLLSPRNRGLLLRNLAEFQTELFRVLAGFIPAISRWELKRELAEMVFRDARCVEGLLERCMELRVGLPEPFPSRVVVGREVIEALCEAEDGAAAFALVFGQVKPAIGEVLRGYLDSHLGVFDAPSLPIVEANLAEVERQLAWARTQPEHDGVLRPAFVERVAEPVARWRRELEQRPKGGAGRETRGRSLGNLPVFRSVVPPDFRFLESGIAPPDPVDYPARAFGRAHNFLQEIQAAETCASLLFEAPDMPWEFYLDLARHMWDETRHCEFGERKLSELGHDIRQVGVSNLAYVMRQTLTPADRYAALTTQEADAFPGKNESLSDAIAHNDELSARAWSYDIADETQHVRYGQKWLSTLLKAMEDPRSCEQVRRDAANWRRDVLGAAYRPAASFFEREKTGSVPVGGRKK